MVPQPPPHRYEIEVDSQDEYYDSEAMMMQRPAHHEEAAAASSSPVQSTEIRSVVRRKGRGFSTEAPSTQVLGGIKHFDTIREEFSGRALRSVEGWVLFVSNLNEEVTEDEVKDKFSDYGKVCEVRLNLDHRTGYVKGYALVEFEEYKQAVAAIEDLNGREWLGNRLSVDFCFVKPQQKSS